MVVCDRLFPSLLAYFPSPVFFVNGLAFVVWSSADSRHGAQGRDRVVRMLNFP